MDNRQVEAVGMGAQEMPEANSILQHSPNGIVLVDEAARIQHVNPAFRRMFLTGEGDLVGRQAAEFLQSDCCEKAISGGREFSVRGSVAQRNFHYRASLFRIEGRSWWCGIFTDISDEERARAELSDVKRETLARAEEVIKRQMQTAQEIAGLLGETTADTKVLVVRLADLFRQEGAP